MGKNKKVILFFPKVDMFNFWMPLSIYSLVPNIVSAGFEPIIIDANLEKNPYDILFKYLDDCICVGISSQIGSQIKGAIEISKLIKSKNPELPIIWGGYFPTLEPEIVLNTSYVDAVVIGQGQLTFRDILKALDKGLGLKGIKGIYFKENRNIIKNQKRPISSLKCLPSIQYDKFSRKYLHHAINSKTMIYNSSEGCSNKCTFCCVSRFFSKQWYSQEANRVIKDLIMIKTKTGANGIYFCDPNFFINTKRVEAICKGMIKKKLNLKWLAYGTINQFLEFNSSFISLLKKSGFSQLTVGAESGAQYVLDNVKKNMSTNKIFKLADLCFRNDIAVRFLFMVGFPGNSNQVKKEVNATFNISRKLINDYPDHEIHWHCYKPLTPKEFSIAERYGFKKPSRIEDWIDLGNFSLVNTPWINQDMKRFLSAFLLYYTPILKPFRTRMLYLGKNPNILEKGANYLAKWRLNNNFFSFPIEYWLKEKFKIFHER